jgi:hypothetical protein
MFQPIIETVIVKFVTRGTTEVVTTIIIHNLLEYPDHLIPIHCSLLLQIFF